MKSWETGAAGDERALLAHAFLRFPFFKTAAGSPSDCEADRPALNEERLAVIWADVLGRKHVGVDNNFFDLGGDSLLYAVLQQRIATEFGQRIPFAELFQSPTVRQQAELIQRRVKEKPVLPPGVLALQPYGTRKSIFWAYDQSLNLAKAIGGDQPFLSIVLTAEDFASLGETPTLQNIAACLLRKILATQSKGPYIIGGFCDGGILAYEIASQLQVAGHVGVASCAVGRTEPFILGVV
jgi:aryl carrier-like protein